jgi:glycosyltransferase involved in cell wall biosynthesis
MQPSKILVLICAWNEASRISPIIAAAKTVLPVLVVDDGSDDNTAMIARAAGAQVVSHPQNRGKGIALLTGFSTAMEQGFDAVLTLDADGQHDPVDIPALLDAFHDGKGDLIIGKRNWSQMPFPRRLSNPFGSWMLSKILGVPVYDSQSGFRIYSRNLIEGLNLTTAGFELETEVIIQAATCGFQIGEAPIRTIYDVGEVSYYHPLRDTARFFSMLAYAYQQRNQAQ